MNKEQFLKNLNQFHLGKLTTESFHPLTLNLSQKINSNLDDGIDALKSVDVEALERTKKYTSQIYNLSQQIKKTILSGNKIFISGCGATGRLALLVEKQFRQIKQSDRVIGFMAGGDYALIKSVESFEDKSEYGSKQLMELGFSSNDLLLGVSEGGETSFVLGTLEEAASIGAQSCFIYCNPNSDLLKIDRSMSVCKNPLIEKLCLNVGAMALSGSTRMQATSVQLLAINLALYEYDLKEDEFKIKANHIIDSLMALDYQPLNTFIVKESSLYDNNEIITYRCEHSLALNILTDTTERSPTFSLASFESLNESHQALCFLSIQNTADPKKAWSKMLGNREPRAINWRDMKFNIKLDDILAFDISQKSAARRSTNVFDIAMCAKGFEFTINSHTYQFDTHGLCEPYSQIALKLLLNTLSTSIMGLQGRYIGNMMTYVKPSNMKLIDRAVRYIENLLGRDDIKLEYNEIVDTLFDELDSLLIGESIVLKVYKRLKS